MPAADWAFNFVHWASVARVCAQKGLVMIRGDCLFYVGLATWCTLAVWHINGHVSVITVTRWFQEPSCTGTDLKPSAASGMFI